MSLENDPFDTQPAPLPPQPPPELEPQPPGQYTDISGPPQREGPRVPIAVWIGLAILGIALCIAMVLLVILLTQGGGGGQARPTPTPTPVQPSVVAIPDVVSGGILVTLQGSHLRPNDLMVFYLRDPAKPTEPILKIGSVQTDPTGRFAWSFTYPSDPRWALIPNASVIVQSTATGGYLTAPLQVAPTGTVATSTVPTVLPPTWTPAPPVIVLTPTPAPVIYPTLTQTPDRNAWRGEYFNNPNLQGSPIMVRNDPSVNFNWNGSPAANIPTDYFSMRWTRTFNILEGGMYRFSARVDDGIRVWLDSSLIIDEWHTATPNTILRDINVPVGEHVMRVEYFEGVGTAFINFSIDKITSYPDWRGDYFNNQFLSGAAVYTRNDAAVSFDWSGAAPAPGVPNQNFSVRWTRTVEFAPGNYRFTMRVNGGANLLIDGSLVIGQWNNNVNGTFTADYTLGSGTHTFEIDYYNVSGSAYIWFTYQPLTGSSSGWNGNYFANDRWSGIPTLVRFDPDISFDWSTSSPGPLLPLDRFSARWTRVFNLPAAGLYRIDVTVDDGVRVYVDNNVILDQVKESSAVNYTTQVQLTQGNHEFRVEYVEYSGQAVMKFNLTPVNVFVTPTPAPPTSTFTPTPQVPPTNTFTPPPATPTVPPPPVINSFTAQPQQVLVGAQCVTLTWSTSNAISAITIERTGQTWSNLSASGSFPDCSFPAGTNVYTLTVTTSPYYGPVTATQSVQGIAPPTVTFTPTPTPTPTPTVGI